MREIVFLWVCFGLMPTRVVVWPNVLFIMLVLVEFGYM